MTKPTPARMVLFYPAKNAPPWPAIVLEVREAKNEIRCDLQVFATKGHGPQSIKEGVPFVDVEPARGTAGTCSYPPRVEEAAAPPPAPPAA